MNKEKRGNRTRDSSRTRNFSLVTYLCVDDVLNIINKHESSVAHWALCVHDKEECEPHIHILLIMKNALTFTCVRNWFPEKPNTLYEEIISVPSAFRYLYHGNAGDKNKFQYGKESVLVSSDYFEQFCEEKENETDSLLEAYVALYDGRTTWHECCLRYGRDFIVNIGKVREALALSGIFYDTKPPYRGGKK